MKLAGAASGFWTGRRVFLTGHTGFKGGWLALWLAELGAAVTGFALPAAEGPSLWAAARVDGHVRHVEGDVRAAPALAQALAEARPEVVFHLAAQPLVRRSYVDPIETYAVNVMGTAHLLEAVRATPGVAVVVVVTTDKVYENREWVWPYRETDPLGGYDPYSSSKACAELVTAAYRRSFLADGGTRVATARAGNVIGGGDWATDRLIPDFLRAIDAGEVLTLRSPNATRPWQHVLEPLAGYIRLAELLHAGANAAGPDVAIDGAYNFGPDDADARPVRWIADRLCARVPGAAWRPAAGAHPHEAHTLRLDSSHAAALLGWRPRWRLDVALDHTLDWHTAWRAGADMGAVCRAQIAAYTTAAA